MLNSQTTESTTQFEERKRDHITLALQLENEAVGLSGFDRVRLEHEALPDIDFSEIQIHTNILNHKRSTPFLVSSMTAGHVGSVNLNQLLAAACEQRGWMMGVGSQRRELTDPDICEEWRQLRKKSPKVQLLGNLGLAQVIKASNDQIRALVDALEAEAMIVHLNPLQECLQPEGTPQFRGGYLRIQKLVETIGVPVIVKETGCGFSSQTIKRLDELGVAAVDVSGFGGTHWGRIEGHRSDKNSVLSQTAKTFANWGISTVDSLKFAQNIPHRFELWASGGVRSGLDAAKALALGAQCVGFAKPILQAALQGEESLITKMKTIEYELQTALFCTGHKNVSLLKNAQVLI